VDILDSMIEHGLYLLIFLMPVLILPNVFEVYEFSKFFLLVFGVALLFFMWVLDSIFVRRRIQLANSFISIFFLVFILVLFISSYFSVDKASSFLGYSGNFSDSFLFYLGLFFFYNLFASYSVAKGAERVVTKALRALIYSALFVSLISLPYYFGLSQLPLFGTAAAGFNLVSGYFHTFAIYLLVMLFVILYDLSRLDPSHRRSRAVDIFTAFLIAINLVMVDWAMIYLVIFVLCGAILLFGAVVRGEGLSARSEYLVLALMVFSSLLFVSSLDLNQVMSGKVVVGDSSVASYLRQGIGVEIAGAGDVSQNGFDAGEAVGIAQRSVAARPVLGSGLGTYHYDFFKYKSVGYNYGANWTAGFNKAYNEILEKVSTIGILGLLSYAFLILAAFVLAVRNIREKRSSEYLLAAFVALLIFQFLFLETSVSKFLFVLFLAVIAAEQYSADATPSAERSTRWQRGLSIIVDNKKLSGAVISFLGVIAILVCSTSLILGFQIFRAEAQYRTLSSSTAPENIDPKALEEIISLNPYKGDYAAGISRIFIARIYRLPAADANDQVALNKLAVEINNALDYARKAVEISPSDVYLWQNYGLVYKTLNDVGMSGGNDWAIKGYETALTLSPNDPVLRVKISEIYLLKYQEAMASKKDDEAKTYLNKAESYLGEALGLKNDYVDATLDLALVYSYEGDRDKELAAVDQVSQFKGLGLTTAVEIGRLYYNMGEKDKAKNALNSVIAIDQNNADAHFILGSLLRDDKKYAEALQEFQKVSAFNADNDKLKQAITETQALLDGKPVSSDKKTGATDASGSGN
jgi:tetratricopeptide (TPR) repeat protein